MIEPKVDDKPYNFFDEMMAVMEEGEVLRRGTGRTQKTLDAMQDGDAFIVTNRKHAEILLKTNESLREKKVIIFAAANEKEMRNLLMEQLRGFRGNIHIDHHLLRNIYMARLADMERMHKVWTMHNKPFADGGMVKTDQELGYHGEKVLD